jgi:hypothetical protein
VLTAARAGWGGLLILAASRLNWSFGPPSDRRALVVMRVLGLRHLLQAAVVHQRGRYSRVGALFDLVHGLSMLSLAVLDKPRRKAALLDATVAFGFAAAGSAVESKTVGASADANCILRRFPSR